MWKSGQQILIGVTNKTFLTRRRLLPVSTYLWATVCYKWPPIYEIILLFLHQPQFSIFNNLTLLSNVFRCYGQYTTIGHSLRTTALEGRRKKYWFALHFKQTFSALGGNSIPVIGLSSLTYFQAMFYVQYLWKVSEPPLRCLAES